MEIKSIGKASIAAALALIAVFGPSTGALGAQNAGAEQTLTGA